MSLKNSIFFVCVLFVLPSCSMVKPKPVVISTDHINTCVEPPKASSIAMRSVEFKVTQDENGIYWISLTPKDYENLSKNTSDMLAHIKEKNAIIKYYRDCNSNDKDN